MADDWKKPRGHGQHLTEQEIEFIRRGFREGRRAANIARDLMCSSRVVNKYFARFGGEDAKRARPRTHPTVTASARFYRSNFEPT